MTQYSLKAKKKRAASRDEIIVRICEAAGALGYRIAKNTLGKDSYLHLGLLPFSSANNKQGFIAIVSNDGEIVNPPDCPTDFRTLYEKKRQVQANPN